jgi:molybdopterin synthase sulfur carrier subunit
MKQITIIYFAQLGQQRGLTEETIATDVADISELYQHLKKQHNLSLAFSNIRVARNEEFCSADSSIDNGDTIAFMPPMSGG